MDLFSRLSTLVLFALLASHPWMVAQQVSRSAEEEFAAAMALYRKAKYDSAASTFANLIRTFPSSPMTSAAMAMKGKAELYGGKLTEADNTLRAFITNFPLSSYLPDAQYTLGLVEMKRREYEKATSWLLDAMRSGEKLQSPRLLRESIVAALDVAIDENISVESLRRLFDAAAHPVVEEFLLVKLSEKERVAGNRAASRSALDKVRRKFPRPMFETRIAEAERKLREPIVPAVGVLLPLLYHRGESSGRDKEIGLGLQEGIETAREEFAGKVDVVLRLENSTSDPIAAAKRLADDPSTIGIVGPVFSDQAQSVVAVATEYRIPIISPTANANGIADSSEFMFQANPDIQTRAKAIAQHAVLTMKLKRLAILGSAEPASTQLAEAFAKEVARLGGEIVGTETYAQHTTNLLKQLTSLRRKGNASASEPFVSFNELMTKTELDKLARLGISRRVLDTLKAKRSIVNMTEFLGAEAKTKLNLHGIRYSNGDPRVDSVQRIVTALQGIYCPIASTEEIGIVSSQLAFYGITTRLLGSGEWNSPSDLNASRRYTRDIVFETDYYLDTKSADYASFAARYMRRFNKVPSRFAVLGYDTAKLLLTLLHQGASTREQLRDALVRVNNHQGLHARFSFDKRRVNSWMHLLQYTRDGLNRIAEISVE